MLRLKIIEVIIKKVSIPMKTRDYETIEERFNINVNVSGYENRVFPLYVSKKFNKQVLNVLLIKK